ncbi:integrin beta-1-binding protein 1-like [Asterias amurensis]|uniref:integrin beta-1-binding protein 1-like n=1 Tax=Asterias amurensis TaxID=7602 RepID=UPI003AB11ED9
MFRKKKKQRSDPEEVAIAAALQAAASVHTGHLPHRQGSRESAVQTSHRGLQQAASNHTQESANMVHQSLPDDHLVMSSQHITDPTSGLPGQLVSVDLSVDFSVRYVGMIYNAQGLQHFQEDEVDLINALDQAQMENQFKHAETQRDFVYLNLSKHGVKVIESYAQAPKIVRWRYGMIEVVRLVHFEDSTGSQLLALKICKEGDDVYDCLLFHCEDQAQARQICQLLGVLFDAVCQDPSLQP